MAPLMNDPYSEVSGDFDPIHNNPCVADFASVRGAITHGLWLSTATRNYVENVVAQGHPECVPS